MGFRTLRTAALAFFFSLSAVGTIWAAQKDYVLGPGDVVKISIYDHPDMTTEARISQENTITFPLLGAVKIGGDTSTAAEATIAERLAQKGFVKQAQVNIVVTEFHSQQVYVLGHVNKPGRYPLEGTSTLLEIIAVAGGINSDGANRAVLVRKDKGGPVREHIDLLEPFYPNLSASSDKGEPAANIEMRNGDVIFVPRAPRFYVYGEVQKPGVYRLERHMTVMQALSVAGGFTQRANDDDVSIKRREKSGKVNTLPSPDLTHLLQANDVIYVKASLF